MKRRRTAPRLAAVWHFLQALHQRFAREHLFLLSAGIAFNMLLCVVPIGLLILWGIALLLPADLVETAFQSVLLHLVAPSAQLERLLQGVLRELRIAFAHSSIAGVIGAVGLLWSASALLQSLRTGLDAVFGRDSTSTGWLLHRLRDAALTVALLLVSLLLGALTIGWSILTAFGTELLPEPWHSPLRWTLGLAITLVVEFALFLFLFSAVPSRPPALRVRLVASLAAVVLLELARVGFLYYLQHVPLLGYIYGSYIGLAALGLWTYYASFLLLLSATVAHELFWFRTHGA